MGILNNAQKFVGLSIVDFDVSIRVSYCQAQTMVQECHTLYATFFGLSWFDLAYDHFFAEIVESDSTVLMANYDDRLHLVCNHVANG